MRARSQLMADLRGVFRAGAGPRSSVLLVSGKDQAGLRRSLGSLRLDECNYVVPRELVATLESGELDEERERDDLSFELFHQLDRPGDGPAGRQEVVDDEHFRAGTDGVAVHLERGRAVLEVVFDADYVGRQLAELAHRHETHAQLVRDRRAEDEAA